MFLCLTQTTAGNGEKSAVMHHAFYSPEIELFPRGLANSVPFAA